MSSWIVWREPPGEHRIEQFWHLRREGPTALAALLSSGGKDADLICRSQPSPTYSKAAITAGFRPPWGPRKPLRCLSIEQRAALPVSLATMIDLSGKARTLRFRLRPDECGADCVYDEEAEASITW